MQAIVPTALLLALCAGGSSSFQLPPSTPAAVSSSSSSAPSLARRQVHRLFEGKDDGDCDGCSDAPAAGGDAPLTSAIEGGYLPAMDPKYPVRGPVGGGRFVISRSGPPTPEELSNENILKIVKIECTDLEANTLVWKCLGYRFDEENEEWTPEEVFPKWKERFPDPPDLIGMKRVYSREVDQPSLRSNQALVRSIPADNKQSLKVHMKPLGWTGFQVRVVSWL